ncbi:HD domain-containing protein [Psychromonas aquimarina]|uniref:HD domain-containing protein n=1 Tax=Psychromonas aquimarina TaxID=444919 RepID=UPI000684457E|nr:HD domain-containing protein [Psychromonas aquimarina]
MKTDLAHDFEHVLRVVKTAKELCRRENAQPEVVIPAAWLHDCFSFAKDHPDRRNGSKYAADKAVEFLRSIAYPEQYFEAVHHAVAAHSFSANIKPLTIEAQIVQDADRLDALGAVGISRCIQVSAALHRPLYRAEDPFCSSREPDDAHYTIDHFYKKLLLIAASVNTESAKVEAAERTLFMQDFLKQLNQEISPVDD